MIAGLTYIFASIAIVVLIRYAAKDHHEILEEVEVFRYSKALQLIILAGIPIAIIAGAIGWLTARPGIDNPLIMNIGLAVFLCIAIALAFVYVFVKRYFVAVSPEFIKWGSISKSQLISFREIKRIDIQQMEKGRAHLLIYDVDGSRVLRATKELQDFDSLIELVTRYGQKYGVEIKSW